MREHPNILERPVYRYYTGLYCLALNFPYLLRFLGQSRFAYFSVFVCLLPFS